MSQVFDRSREFQSIVASAKRQQKLSSQRQALLTPEQQKAAYGTPKARSAFAQQAASISKEIGTTMDRLGRLASLAKNRSLFADNSVEVSELSFVIKQSLAKINNELNNLKSLSKQGSQPEQVSKHSEGVVLLLQTRLGSATTAFKDTLELRSKNLQASRERTAAFTSSVSNPASLPVSRTDSPLYSVEQRNGSAGKPYQLTQAARSDILSLDMPTGGDSALSRAGGASAQQLMLLEEGAQSNSYIQERGNAIDQIERTMTELGGIFTQLAQMVSEQGEQIQRIDANTDAVVENVEGAQRELLKYWNRMSGNRWLVAKMFGVLMIFFLLWVLIAG
ncbi:uncharacterized protein PV09_01711 [Verruconis gallopava]|uniref:t-SNARE coiled-coil homology domain-containing protein n=1 Tax=Verruconis gallopava TaxID=253628 RepID=A0A0D2AMQ6_9PEZI|nr:uncharacterized protein PV09_01711 [Verruconis gallopava]KIW07785.1 hypothetical protein PV09_01711 [Verruconis gallopava]